MVETVQDHLPFHSQILTSKLIMCLHLMLVRLHMAGKELHSFHNVLSTLHYLYEE